MLTIGQLAKKVGVRTSTLRYYEQVGLLTPDSRSPAGYRLYSPKAEQILHLIRRAQRLGFSLSDLRTVLDGWQAGDLSDAALIETAEKRYLALEQRITELLTQQHELELFLQDLHRRDMHSGEVSGSSFAQMLARACANPLTQPPAMTMLERLMQYSGCKLTSEAGQQILDRLRGQHLHIWQEGDAYYILIVSEDPAVARALRELAQLESSCEVHGPHQTPELVDDDEGYLLKAGGDNAFLFARLFLALEQEV
jgi:DNA-binding transcriptional MerR regulator